MGWRLRVGPVRLTNRGVRLAIGPRAARLTVGTGRPTVSTGVGPFSAWRTVGRRRPAVPVSPPVGYAWGQDWAPIPELPAPPDPEAVYRWRLWDTATLAATIAGGCLVVMLTLLFAGAW